MTQTMKSQNTPASKKGRLGQRQKERQVRLARRRRRQQITFSIIGVVALIAVAGLGYWQYQRYEADQQTASKDHAAATAGAVKAHAAATAKALITPTPSIGSPTPAPAAPPAVSGTPVKLADGLEYIDMKVGVGPAVQKGGSISVYYTGWLQSNGQKFDSSYDEGGTPYEVTPLGQASVIPGWNEGLIGMKSGGERRLIIPPALAYGAAGQGKIPANATLIFDVTATGVK